MDPSCTCLCLAETIDLFNVFEDFGNLLQHWDGYVDGNSNLRSRSLRCMVAAKDREVKTERLSNADTNFYFLRH